MDVILSLMGWWFARSANHVHLWTRNSFQENEILLRDAWAKEQEVQERREEEKREKRVGPLIKERSDMGNASTKSAVQESTHKRVQDLTF